MFRSLSMVFPTVLACGLASAAPELATAPVAPTAARVAPASKPRPEWLSLKLPFALRLAAAAEERAHHHVIYDGSGYPMAYPMGDVPADRGTCTDEVVRAYRLVGVDLQQLVHEDMVRDFAAYPRKYHLSAPDPNIDHRRVYNLQAFFNRNADVLPITNAGKDYKPGEVIIWDLDNFQLHIGLVTRKWSKKHLRPLVMHNISSGPHVEDKLFEYKIIGHYRFEGGLKPETLPAPFEASAKPADAPPIQPVATDAVQSQPTAAPPAP